MAKSTTNKIYRQDWETLHTSRTSTADSKWYLQFAEDILPVLKASKLIESFTFDDYKDLALVLALYLEDAVSVSGGWHRFKVKYRSLYERELPFYTVTDANYYEDEINEVDVCVVIWTFLSVPQDKPGTDYLLIDPYSDELINLAKQVYTLMDRVFEEAPVSDGLSVDWVMDPVQLNAKRKTMPSVRLEECTSSNSKRVLKHTGGYPLVFIHTYQELTHFFISVLGWENKKEALMPEMSSFENFVLYANSKGMLLAPEVATYFKSDRNGMYDAESAQKEGYMLVCEQGACPYDLIKYGVSQGYFDDFQMPFIQGKTLWQENWDFIGRWYLGLYYEGD